VSCGRAHPAFPACAGMSGVQRNSFSRRADKHLPLQGGGRPPKARRVGASARGARRRRVSLRAHHPTPRPLGRDPPPAGEGAEIRSRDASASELCKRHSKNPPQPKGGGAPTGASIGRIKRMRPRADRSPLASRRSTAALARGLRPTGSTPGHASWDVDPAGVTRPHLSQSRESTSHTGRSTGMNDAQSRPGAGCKPARRRRSRSAFKSAL
jgi:hypothetical protein